MLVEMGRENIRCMSDDGVSDIEVDRDMKD